jgi:methionyl-tRNA formyltransferase
VHQPVSLRGVDAGELIAGLQPDLMIVVAYGLLLPPEILGIPEHGCWNIHASLLPRWRGAAPIQRAIEAGDEESGVCIMQMDEGLDTGPVIHRASLPLSGAETGGQLHDRLAGMGADALLVPLRALARGESIELTPQSENGVCYAAKLRKSDAQIDWSEPAAVLERRIRAFNPWPVAWCMIGEERTRIWKAVTVPRDHGDEAGTVVKASSTGIDIATGSEILRLLEIQRPGKRRTNAADYLNARSLPAKLNTRS